jgi:coproporphyrinogen III oxidase-like Fe-S oxidoreductase
VERLTPDQRATERLMLGLRLDRPLALNGLATLVDDAAAARLAAAGLLVRGPGTIQLSERGRFLADDVVATLLA